MSREGATLPPSELSPGPSLRLRGPRARRVAGNRYIIFGNRPWVKPIEWQFVIKITDGLTQQGRRPRNAASGKEPNWPEPPETQAPCLAFAPLALRRWPKSLQHLLCPPGGETLARCYRRRSSQAPVPPELRGRLAAQRGQGLAQSHTARGRWCQDASRSV